MKYSLLLLLSVMFVFGATLDVVAQDDTHTVVIQLKDFTTEKNLSIYEMFRHDDHVQVVNSCDILGLVVIESRMDSPMSGNETRGYSTVRLNELFEADQYLVKEGMSAYDVMTSCRQAMQEELSPEK
ncbi:MAG: hypothetical protein HKN79_00420 [Flavobacteriales bacterium]|nr:hypothetical protein [Flavobacteriales bacterium]